jgi:uncharacterized damage-inducible protein DinB
MDNIIAKKFFQQYEMMVGWINETMGGLSDEDFKTELSPGKNHGVWILGHMIVCDDDFSLYMGKGELLYPEFAETFGQSSKILPVEDYPPVAELKGWWNKVCLKNKKIYSELKDSEFDEPHALVTDFEKDFFKTKGRVVMAWQLHQMYHNGQLGVILSRAGKSKF